MKYNKLNIYKLFQNGSYHEINTLIDNQPEEIKTLKNDSLILDLLFSENASSNNYVSKHQCFKFFMQEGFARSEKLFAWICAHGSHLDLNFYLLNPDLKKEINETEFQISVKNTIINSNYDNLVLLCKYFKYEIPSHFLAISIERSLMSNFDTDIIDLLLDRIGYIDDYTYNNSIKDNKYNLAQHKVESLHVQYEKQKMEVILPVSSHHLKKIKI